MLSLEKIKVVSYTGKEVFIEINHERDNLLTDFGKKTLEDRYLIENETYQTRFGVVAGYFSDSQEHGQRMYDYISQLLFMGATPVTGNGGTEKGLSISCFLNWVDDTIKGILETKMETNWLSALGGGTGTFWGDVRSIGEPIRRVGKSGGVIPFICAADGDTIAISQGSLRRGSNAAYLDDRHPEFDEFINVRKPTGGDPNRKAMNIHHGVCFSDEFMEAVDNNDKWELLSPHTKRVIKETDARTMWQDTLDTRLSNGEPYILFTGNANKFTNPVYKKLGLKIRQSNLCIEIMETTGPDHLGKERTAVCCLGSINILFYDKIIELGKVFIKDCMVFLDNVLQDFINKASELPFFEKAVYSATRERSIGLGIMGFHSYLQSNMIPFESPMAIGFNHKFFNWYKEVIDECNIEIALEKGSCPDAIDAGMVRRFANATTIAPTASISIIAANTSPGIEPYISNAYTQKTLSGSFAVKNPWLDKLLIKKYEELKQIPYEPKFKETLYKETNWYKKFRNLIFKRSNEMVIKEVLPKTLQDLVHELSLEKWLEKVWSLVTTSQGSVMGLSFLTDYEKSVFATAFEISPDWIIEHAGIYCKKIDQGVSLNIFIPADIDKVTLHRVHFKAWKKGIKGLYYLRSRSVRQSETISYVAGTMPTETDRTDEPRNDHLNYEECLACQ